MRRNASVLLVAIVCGHVCVTQAAEPSLDSLKQTYEAEAQKIRDAREAKLSRLLDAYGRSLDKAVGLLKKKGDPDTVLQAIAEKRRFDNDRAVPTESDPKLPQLLQDTQASYLRAVGKVDAETAQAIAQLSPSYIAALERLMKALTAQEKLDLALNVKAEKERVEFVLADIETKTAKQGTSVERDGRKPGDEMTIDLGNGVEMAFVWIPPGSYQMGSRPSEERHERIEGPVHQVTISSGFWMGKYEVTQEQWQRIMGANPSKFRGPKNPVETVTWNATKRFIGEVNDRVEGGGLRLPTEAEWEYACRAGTKTRFHTGTSESGFARCAWYEGNGSGKTHPVGLKMPNKFGLYDMHGNVVERCADWIGGYTSKAVTNPVGPHSGKQHVNRGGGFKSKAWHCRSAWRGHTDNAHVHLGFRLARTSLPQTDGGE